jgi:hypothetical protein
MTKFTIAASIMVFALGTVVGRATAPSAVLANEAKIESISIDELSHKAGPLSVESFDAV